MKSNLGVFTNTFTSEVLPPLSVPVSCPSNKLEFPYLYDDVVSTHQPSGDQLFSSFTSAVLCLDPTTGAFTFEGTAVYTGGTGQFAGASGSYTASSKGTLLSDGSGSQRGKFEGTLNLAVTCPIANLIAASKKADSLLACYAKAARLGEAVDEACISKAEDIFVKTLAKEEEAAIRQGGQCSIEENPADIEAAVDAFVTEIVTALRPTLDASKCAVAKLNAVSNAVFDLLKAQLDNKKKSNTEKLSAAIVKAIAALTKAFAKAEDLKNGNCLTTPGVEGIRAKIEFFAQGVLPACDVQDVSDEQRRQAAVATAIQGVSDPWGEDLAIVLARAGAELGCRAIDLHSTFDTSRTHAESQTATQRDCVNTYCPDVNYCGPGNEETNPLLAVVTVGNCLNRNCWDHDLCYNPHCVNVADKCYFTGQANSTDCDSTLLASCADPSCLAEDFLALPLHVLTCDVIAYLIRSRPVPDICLNPPCEPGEICNQDSGMCEDSPRCGNGQIETGEQCDDGNNVNGDGCSLTCICNGPFSYDPIDGVCKGICPAGCEVCGRPGDCTSLPLPPTPPLGETPLPCDRPICSAVNRDGRECIARGGRDENPDFGTEGECWLLHCSYPHIPDC